MSGIMSGQESYPVDYGLAVRRDRAERWSNFWPCISSVSLSRPAFMAPIPLDRVRV